MAELVVEKTYATALYGAAEDASKVDEILADIQGIDEIFQAEPDFHEFFGNPTISGLNRKEAIRQIFDGRVNQEVINFLCILIDKNKARRFHGIVKQYKAIQNKKLGFAEGVVYSVIPLDEENLKKCEESTSKLLRENVKLKNEIDSKIIGGIKILVNGKIIDASIQSRLDTIRTGLIKQS